MTERPDLPGGTRPAHAARRKLRALQMRKLRALRREAGFVEITIWVPGPDKERITRTAADLRAQFPALFPGTSGHDDGDACAG